MTLDTLQTRFLDEFLHGEGHIVLTGKAGTGKSTALCAAVKGAKALGMDVLVMAPTAMAASVHRDNGLESGTIHHALKWNPAREPLPRKLLAVCGWDTDMSARPDRERVLVIDEASMVGLWLFEILMRDLGDGRRPFDGRRLVLVGDWAQLPPVVGPEEAQMAKAMPELAKFGPPDGCVLFHRLFRERRPSAVALEETHRANGPWFAKLNELRDCSRTSTLRDFGMNFPAASRGDDPVHLCFRRSAAHQRNAERLARLPGREIVLPLRDGEIGLKEGCEVIVTSNRAGSGYINGSRAVFSGLDENGRVVLDDGAPICMLADGNWTRAGGGKCEGDEAAGRHMAQRLLSRYGGVLDKDAADWLKGLHKADNSCTASALGAGRVQFLPYWPILPGYAVTVHKAQGMGLSSAVIEEDVFWSIAPARLPYVALSRVSDEADIRMAVPPSLARVRPDVSYPPVWSRIQNWSRQT